MSRTNISHVAPLKAFATFTAYFWHYCFVLSGILGTLLAIVILLGVAFAHCEGIPVLQGVYFAAITSTTVGFGDITPGTGLGQCISVLLAGTGLILFGLAVAVATKALTVTVEKQLRIQIDPESALPEK